MVPCLVTRLESRVHTTFSQTGFSRDKALATHYPTDEVVFCKTWNGLDFARTPDPGVPPRHAERFVAIRGVLPDLETGLLKRMVVVHACLAPCR